MISKCPGQDFRKLRVGLYKCPNCDNEVEIFSDEMKVKCHKCGETVYREKMPSCVEWCASARQCVGEERWQELNSEDEIPKVSPPKATKIKPKKVTTSAKKKKGNG